MYAYDEQIITTIVYKYYPDLHAINTVNPTAVKNQPAPGIKVGSTAYQAVVLTYKTMKSLVKEQQTGML